MRPKKIRYSAVLISDKAKKAALYEASMEEAVHDEAFLERTLRCAKDFEAVDAEFIDLDRSVDCSM